VQSLAEAVQAALSMKERSGEAVAFQVIDQIKS
jgi:hypothetical protein